MAALEMITGGMSGAEAIGALDRNIKVLNGQSVATVNNLTTTVIGSALDATQGKILKDQQDEIKSLTDDNALQLANIYQQGFNVKSAGAKGDANFLYTDGLYYTDNTHTVLANDDSVIIQHAIDTYGIVFLPGKHLITVPILLSEDKEIYGIKGKSELIKVSTNNVLINSTNINSIVVASGTDWTIKNIILTGNISNNVNGITFGEGASMFTIDNIEIRSCKRALHDFLSCYIGEFNKVHIGSCDNAFVLDNTIEKTALTFNNCWAENCGQSWSFVKMVYSSLINCACDWGNYTTVGNPYGIGYGNRATALGVYNFELCRGVSMISCGSENSFGNGLVSIYASIITMVNCLSTIIKSEYQPDYTTYPNYAVGNVNILSESSTVTIIGGYFSDFENTWVKINRPEKDHACIAYNSIIPTNKKMITISGVFDSTGYSMFKGQGDYLKDCQNLDELGNSLTVNDYIDVGGVRQFKTLALSGVSKSKIRIPILSQWDSNYVHMIRLRGINNENNTSTAIGFYAEIQFASLNVVSNVTVLSSSIGLTATENGATLEISLPNVYNSMKVECSVISQDIKSIDFTNTTLV